MARAEGVERVIYLGGLGDRPHSQHLRSRHETALALREHGPAADLLPRRDGRRPAERVLPHAALPRPATAGDDRAGVAAERDPADRDRRHAELPDRGAHGRGSAGREIQIGGPDVLTYGEMLDRMADVLGIRRRPRIPVPLITPWLSSLWIGLVTPVDAGVARPLIEGLAVPTVVTDPSRDGAVRRRADHLRRCAQARRRGGPRGFLGAMTRPRRRGRPQTGGDGSGERRSRVTWPAGQVT